MEQEKELQVIYLSQDGAEGGAWGRLSWPYYSPDYIAHIQFLHSLGCLGDLWHLWKSSNLPLSQVRIHPLKNREEKNPNKLVFFLMKIYIHILGSLRCHIFKSILIPASKHPSTFFFFFFTLPRANNLYNKSLLRSTQQEPLFLEVFSMRISSWVEKAFRVEALEYWQDLNFSLTKKKKRQKNTVCMPKHLHRFTPDSNVATFKCSRVSSHQCESSVKDGRD